MPKDRAPVPLSSSEDTPAPVRDLRPHLSDIEESNSHFMTTIRSFLRLKDRLRHFPAPTGTFHRIRPIGNG